MPTNEPASELLNCPFCGSSDVSFYGIEGKVTEGYYDWVGVTCGGCHTQSDDFKEYAVAAEAWNRRSLPAPPAPVSGASDLPEHVSTENYRRLYPRNDSDTHKAIHSLCREVDRLRVSTSPPSPDARLREEDVIRRKWKAAEQIAAEFGLSRYAAIDANGFFYRKLKRLAELEALQPSPPAPISEASEEQIFCRTCQNDLEDCKCPHDVCRPSNYDPYDPRSSAPPPSSPDAGLREAIIAIILDYEQQCAETACQLAEDETESGKLMYWRADGASDALEHIAQVIKEATLQPSPPADERDERAAFEAWAESDGVQIASIVRASTGEYIYDTAEFSWQVWQARARRER